MGVAFIDTDNPGKTKGRAYLIYESQLDEIQTQEGDAWYKKFALGTIDGIPAFTLTGPGKYEDNVPSKEYQDTINRGLNELENLKTAELKIC